MLKPDDTIQFFTSPYRRTRETTEGILRSLTSDDPTPSPFPRNKITVFEEPRLREQDFGNFQPCSAEMERMWQERADYGHFFYRIPNGESAADAYDRVSGFNESLWRSFGEEDFPSVCVLVTHGLMTRVFLMKWYHWSIEYFEDLRNVNHCEFIVMKQSQTNGKYILENELRTWSELKRRAAAANGPTATVGVPGRGAPTPGNLNSSPTIPVRRWGGCANGCNHDNINWPRRAMRKNTAEFLSGGALPAPAIPSKPADNEQDDHPISSQEAAHTPTVLEPSPSKLARKQSTKATHVPPLPLTPASPNDASADASTSSDEGGGSSEGEPATNTKPKIHSHPAPRTAAILRHLEPPTPGEGFSDDSDYFPGMHHAYVHHNHHHSHNHGHSHNSPAKAANGTHRKPSLRATPKQRPQSKDRKTISRRMSEKNWMEESGMGAGARADTLGDGNEDTSDDAAFANQRSESPSRSKDDDKPILREALKGNMIVENSEEEREDDENDRLVDGKKMNEADIEKMKKKEREGFGEVY
ncbi:hypothetical protein BDV96DRAFT_596094 [Lophiotrema nucula]|uniref:Histidine phosphatase superfamily n=1 Tax=Lophiotrema nucula TaxID=690887 RepID=A0A6A5ZIU6_9PLEO|nr:hypothetical protein BDV96DRAFT_596094 [Lophiotrema nucula]